MNEFFFTESLTNYHYKDYQRFPALLFESHNNARVSCIEIEISAARIYLYNICDRICEKGHQVQKMV